MRCLWCLHGIDRCQAPVVKLSEMLWSDERRSVQLNLQICCFDQFPASGSTCCVCLSVGRRSEYFQPYAEGPQECVGFSHKYLDLDRRNDLYSVGCFAGNIKIEKIEHTLCMCVENSTSLLCSDA